MSVNNTTFAIARRQFTLTICAVYSKQPELTPSGRLVEVEMRRVPESL